MKKSEIKKIKKEIESSLIQELQTVTSKLGEGSNKLTKKIEKGAKKLAKKLSHQIKPITTPPVETISKAKKVKVAETV
jgi:hypothetical protein